MTNTLADAKRLVESGFTHQQPQGISELPEEAIGEDIRDLKESIRAELGTLRNEVRAELQRELRSQMLCFFTMRIAIVSVPPFKLLP